MSPLPECSQTSPYWLPPQSREYSGGPPMVSAR
jgi:hypothetical protein